MKRYGFRVMLLAIFVMCCTSALYAHDYWIEGSGNDFVLVYGHGSSRMAMDPSKVKGIRALDVADAEIAVSKELKGNALALRTKERPSLLEVEIDNGYWSKTVYGWKNLPRRKAEKVVASNRSLFYAKSVIVWSNTAQSPVESGLDISPLKDPLVMKSGDVLPLRVTYNGKPVASAALEGQSHNILATTDSDGVAMVKLSRGGMVIAVDHKERLNNDPDADYLSITATLSFEVPR
ncbi:nickel uptake transporter family protein [Candidatus Magnetobacterium bavaricum]|uniref:Nickel uptake transporter family protein n=1 Tax=Candidatus Magnetobacterium bavaricum TaxID=29290 RepID=A0A0F3GMT5_9BACT|nr:nickel uptake transporter family protein [Candidatus Magnetobacterium bavaricum]